MLKTSRKEALAAGDNTYATGKPCKYGHLSYRYAQSGACAECISESAASTREIMNKQRREFRVQTVARKTAQLQPVLEARQAKTDALKQLDVIKIPIHSRDIATVFDTAVELCLAAFPVLERSDVMPARQPIKGMPLYRVHVPAEQEQLLRDVADALYCAHGADVSRMAERVAHMAEQAADAEASEPPEGWK